MREITITEALSEVVTTLGKERGGGKSIQGRVPSKIQQLVPYLSRPANVVDPLEKGGGSEKYVTEEIQSIRDLLQKVLHIRQAIATVNNTTKLEIEGVTRTVQEWIVWKREVVPHEMALLGALLKVVRDARSLRARLERVSKDAERESVTRARGGQVASMAQPVPEVAEKLHFDEMELQQDIDRLNKIIGKLDGQLSLLNATTKVKLDD